MEGFKERLEAARSGPRVHRHSIVFPAAQLQPEKTPGEVAGKSSQLWSMFDGFTAETEVLDFLYTLVRLVKPERAIETGTWLGRSAVAIGSAMRDNGLGKLVSLEVDPEAANCALTEIETAGLCDWVEVVVEQSLTFESPCELEFALLDSDIGVRADEFRHFYEKLAPGATVVFHDTGAQHAGLAEGIRELISQGRLVGSFFSTPRGIFVGTARKPPEVATEAERNDLRDRLAISETSQIASLTNVVESLNARISSMLASRSWQVTAPLRVLQRWILGRS